MRVRPIAAISLLLTPLLSTACETQPDRATVADRDTLQEISIERLVEAPCDDSLAAHNIERLAEAYDMSESSNEIHDCQRFVMAGEADLTYGPLVAIYPDSTGLSHDDPAAFAGEWVLVARIHDFDNTPYPPLGIESGFNCLQIRRQSNQWQARVVPHHRWDCQQIDVEAPATMLAVHEWGGSNKPGGLYPSRTARWGWDGDPASAPDWHQNPAAPTNTQYIGIKCAGEWCAIGQPGFTPRSDAEALSTTGHRGVPGLYDEQLLAVPDSPGSSNLVPGPWGVIAPLGAGPNTPGAVARISGSGAGYYADKQNPPANAGSGRDNVIRLQQNASAPAGWVANITRPDNTTHQSMAVDTILHQRHGPATGVRWRWLAEDEGAWVPCTGGCCTYNGRGLF